MASTDHLPIDAEQQQTFNGFRKLPTEIRLMIWHMALPGPRVITIQQRTTVERWQRGCLSASYLIPSTLHTSHEARQVALRNYQLSFAQNYINNPIYFDFSQDILFIRGAWICNTTRAFLSKLRHLMISDNNHAFSTFNTSGWVRLKEFQALHSLVLEPQPCFDPAHLMASWNSAEEGIRWHIKGDRKGHLDSKELEGRLSIAIMSEEDMICRAEKLKNGDAEPYDIQWDKMKA
ncbi:hypothetical protein V8E51_004203 [Hyaloscypha variabilis]